MREPIVNGKDEPSSKSNSSYQLESADQFLDEAAEALHIVSPEGIIVWANKQELALLGYSNEEYIGHHISEFYADRFVINDILCRLINNQEVINYPAELLRKDGSKIQVLLSSNVYKKDGNFMHTRSSTRDISELKLFQTRLENSNAKILNQLVTSNSLINLMCSTSWQTDFQGCITSIQSKWQLYSGQDFDEQINYGWLKAFHPEDRIAIKANLISALKENRDFKQLCRVYNKRADLYIYCGLYATPIISLSDHSFEWSFVLIDANKVLPADLA